eukprot:m.264641 g.264641  ORF g.264641 m.264641 type:complete len:1083 (-) comp57275_c0_seq1:29-3277(-)
MASQLSQLQAAFNQVLNPNTQIEEKRQIEQSLNAFKTQDGAWEHSLLFMQGSSDYNVLWYAASVLEYTVTIKWNTIAEPQKAIIRQFLFEYYTKQTEAPYFVQNKVAKVYADVGKRDWPHAYPSFFETILVLMGKSDTAEKGLKLLKIVLEECVAKTSLTAKRGDELLQQVTTQVPVVLAHLSQILDSIYTTANAEAARRAMEQRHPTNLGIPSTPRNSPNLFTGQAQGGTSTADIGGIDAFIKFSPLAESTATKALECILQLFSWINLSDMVNTPLLDTLYGFAQLTDGGNAAIGSLALSCFNEMLTHHCFPPNLEEYLVKLFQHTLALLIKVTGGGDKTSQVEDMDDNYNHKFTEFLGLFISSHLLRVEGDPRFQIEEFLLQLFRFTFLQPTSDGFIASLGVCNQLLEVLSMKLEQQGPDSVTRYKQALTMLTSELVGKLRFSRNSKELMEFDNETRNDDAVTEWEEHLRDCMETVAMVSQIFSQDVMALVLPQYLEDLQKYSHVHECVVTGANGLQLSFANNDMQQLLFFITRDVATMTQVVGRLVHRFSESSDPAVQVQCMQLIQNLVGVLQYQDQHKLYTVERLFVDVHVQIFSTLKVFGGWLAAYGRSTRDQPEESQQFIKIILAVVTCVWTLLSQTSLGVASANPIFVEAAADTLEMVCKVAKPRFLLQSDQFLTLLNNVDVIQRQPLKIRKVLCSAYFYALLTPWYDTTEANQQWAQREGKFLEVFSAVFGSVPQIVSAATNHEQIKDMFELLAVVTLSMRDHNKVSKAIFMKGLNELLPTILQSFQVYTAQPAVLGSILDLLFVIFDSVTTLLTTEFVQQVMGMFLTFFTKEQIESLSLPGGQNKSVILEKFFQILKLLVSTRSNLFKPFLAEIVGLCVTTIFTIIDKPHALDIKVALYDVLKHILLDNWRYFYPMNVVQSQSSASPVQNESQLAAFMQAYLKSFMQTEIALFKDNLETLSTLNTKLRLFQKDYFKQHFYNGFVGTFLSVLVNQSHALLEEDILGALYELASVDFANFYQVSLMEFLRNEKGLDNNEKTTLSQFAHHTDLPSFTKQIQEIYRDVVYLKKLKGL